MGEEPEPDIFDENVKDHVVNEKIRKRQNRIINELKNLGEMEISRLAKILNVHEMTIRRDLKQLEDEGVLVRTLKGAKVVPNRFLGYYRPDEIRNDAELKFPLAIFAAKNLISKGDTIFLGAGTTVLRLAMILQDYFPEYKDLKIFSYGLDVISYLFNNPKFKLNTLGGIVASDSPVIYGPVAETALNTLKVDSVFLEVDSIIAENVDGVLLLNNMESSIFPKALKLSKKAYIFADKTRFERLALYKVAGFDEIPVIITNRLEPEIYEQYKDKLNIVQVAENGTQISGKLI